LATNSVLLSLVLGSTTAAVVAGLVTAFPALGGEPDRMLLWVALASLPVLILRQYLSLLAQAHYAFGITNAAWLSGPVTSLVVNGALTAMGRLSVGTAIVAWVGGQALGALILGAHVSRRVGFGVPDVGLAGRMLRFGLKAHVGRFMSLANYRVDQWILGGVAGSRELGLYSVAVAWAEVLFYLPAVLVMVQRPRIVRATRTEAARLAAKVVRFALLLAAPVAVALFLGAPVLCATVFGEDFRGSVDDLRVLALGAFGIAALELLGSAFTAQRRPLRAAGPVGVAFAATIALDILLIPRYGGVGAATATTLAWTAGGAVAVVVFTMTFPARATELIPTGREVRALLHTLRGARERAAVAGAPPA